MGVAYYDGWKAPTSRVRSGEDALQLEILRDDNVYGCLVQFTPITLGLIL